MKKSVNDKWYYFMWLSGESLSNKITNGNLLTRYSVDIIHVYRFVINKKNTVHCLFLNGNPSNDYTCIS